MKLYLSTPILRTLVVKLNALDIKLAQNIIALDEYIKKSPALREVFGVQADDQLKAIQRFLNESLIQKTVKDCIQKERVKDSLPKPGNFPLNPAPEKTRLSKP